MTKKDVIHQVIKQTGIDPEISRSVIEAFFVVVKSAVSQGETVYMRSFGSFGPKQRAAKVARNITQNTAIRLEAQMIPYFKPSAELANQVRSLKVGTKAEKGTKNRAKKGQ